MHETPSGRSRRFAVSLSMIIGLAGMAHAVDGVIEVNQARALAGGVTASDTAGFPVTIDAPGSYRLTGDLDVGDENTGGINIGSSNVTLDLNGFAILGPVACTDTTCTPESGVGTGVNVPSGFIYTNITVRNGTVRGMGRDGLELEGDSGMRVENVRAISNARNGINVGATFDESAHVTGCTVTRNGVDGINGPEASVITGNVSSFNHGHGIAIRDGSFVSGNTVFDNNMTGITAGSGSLVTGNAVRNNTGFGLDGGAAYSNNAFFNNNGGNPNDQVDSGLVEIGTNQCGADTVCP